MLLLVLFQAVEGITVGVYAVAMTSDANMFPEPQRTLESTGSTEPGRANLFSCTINEV